jgi:hypothetical protein
MIADHLAQTSELIEGLCILFRSLNGPLFAIDVARAGLYISLSVA